MPSSKRGRDTPLSTTPTRPTTTGLAGADLTASLKRVKLAETKLAAARALSVAIAEGAGLRADWEFKVEVATRAKGHAASAAAAMETAKQATSAAAATVAQLKARV